MDLFGKALLAYYRDASDAPIRLIRDDGWVDEHSPKLYFNPEPFDFERPALDRVAGATIDVGCGAGRHVKWISAQGHRATGLDASSGAIEVCRAQGIETVKQVDVMSDPMDHMKNTAETITLFGNNVGIGGTFEGSVALFKSLHGICASGGCLVLTGIDIRQSQRPEHIAYQDKNVADGRRRGEIRLRMQYDGEEGAEFRWFHPEPHEVEDLASLSGLKVEDLEGRGPFFWCALHRV